MTPARKGDGTGLSFNGYSQVRKGDGTVLWDAIPDSVVLQYFADTWSLGNSTWEDDVGNVDMAIVGDPQEATLSDGADSIAGDGTDDRGDIALPAQFEGTGLQAFSVEIAFEFSHSNIESVFGLENGETADTQWLEMRLNRDESGTTTDDGNCYFRLRDDSGDAIDFAFDTPPGLNDGNRHDLSIIINDATASDVTLILDGTEETVAFGLTDNPSNFTTWDSDMVVWARDLGGSLRNYFDGEIGAMRWHDEAISEQTIGDYS